MGAKTGISWTDSTWNPIRGCSRVSEGCRNCYAEGMASRFSGPGLAYEGLAVMQNGKPHWTGKVEFVEKHLLDPLKWGPVREGIRGGSGTLKERHHRDGTVTVTRERPRRIFVNSMSDLFHENVTDEMRDKIFAVMALCPQHIFQVLTKRPARMLAYFTRRECPPEMKGRVFSWTTRQAVGLTGLEICLELAETGKLARIGRCAVSGEPGREGEIANWPLPNVWLGVSVESQKAADERIPLLLQTPAAVRFLSCEPMLGLIELDNWLKVCKWWKSEDSRPSPPWHPPYPKHWYRPQGLVGVGWKHPIDWVICGGESGPHARPMHPNWARVLRDQCKAAGVPFFFKQWVSGLPMPRTFPVIRMSGVGGMTS